MRDLDASKAAGAEKDRLIKQRDSLLESHALGVSGSSQICLTKSDKSHRNTKHQFETIQKTSQHKERNLTQQDARILELETRLKADRAKIQTLEIILEEQHGRA
jgi:division protein CdvB (Snf7/Vps24/ESCRT-III family)